MAAAPELHTLEIRQRPRRTWAQAVNAVLATITFLVGCLMINGSQLVFLLPLKILPFSGAEKAYTEGIRYSKGAFGTLLVLMSQWFAPTKFVLTFERRGPGRLTDEQISTLVERDGTSRVVGLHLPQRVALIANHQVYADWWYAWSLTYYAGMHSDVYIVLKDSLRWLPILGWGMRIFNFIFLKRSWASDRLHLSSSLSWIGRRAETQDLPLAFILYPEGTLISKDTKPLSKKFAEKIGIPDMLHSLLPRSTGLHYSLRSLAPRIPSLQLIDITMTYPGIPPFGYGQSYYTLRSIFLDRVPPPVIHMHIRCFNVANEVPIGDTSSANPNVLPKASPRENVQEVDIPEVEKETFELWLRNIWREKDRLISKYLETGSMVDADEPSVEIPLQLRQTREVFNAFCFFTPMAVVWAWWKYR